MENTVYALGGILVMDVEVDGVSQTRRAILEAYGSRLTDQGGTEPLSRMKPQTLSDEVLCEEIGGTFRIFTTS